MWGSPVNPPLSMAVCFEVLMLSAHMSARDRSQTSLELMRSGLMMFVFGVEPHMKHVQDFNTHYPISKKKNHPVYISLADRPSNLLLDMICLLEMLEWTKQTSFERVHLERWNMRGTVFLYDTSLAGKTWYIHRLYFNRKSQSFSSQNPWHLAITKWKVHG